MNTTWSTYVQNINTLYSSRSIRFADEFKEKYIKAFDIYDKNKILEIGCGPGALAESLHRWYPNAKIFGIDTDSNFITFARENISGVEFLEADATALSFEDNSFDVTISYTVSEHIEPSKFYGEQYRVLKENGVCIVISARKGINITAPCIAEETQFEKEIWQRAGEYFVDFQKKYYVCQYPQNEAELPLSMQEHGFKNISTEYITINLTPDNPCYTADMAYAMINANRLCALDSAERLLHVAGEKISAPEVEELKRIVNAKYDKRIMLYNKGIKLWDTDMSVTMVIRGEK